jgi:class 3 adenylate cyclase
MARTYINEAWHAYQLWGCLHKAAKLMERYRPLIQTYRANEGGSIAGSWQPSVSSSTAFSTGSHSGTGTGSGSASSGVNQLDLMAVMKSANALAGEIDLDRLFGILVRITMESAGAQRGLLVLRQAEGLVVRSIGESDKTIEVRLAALPLDQCAELDQSIVTYVERTRTPLVYTPDNARELFRESAYIREHHPASILCLPIINNNRLQGLLYLENRLSAAVFTPQHLETLQMLSSQIGIALENAQLFHDQRRLTEVYSRFVPMEFLKLLGKESILDVKLADQVNRDMTIMFTDIRSFTSLSEQMTPAENFNFLNSYLARVSPVVRNNRGFIDKYLGDGLMALFPVSEQDAIQAAIGIQRTLTDYNQGRILAGHPAIGVGIGLHSGSLMLGTIGESERMETTVISDAVNIASRLESLSKRYGVPILVSELMIERTKLAGHYKSRFLDRVVLVGKNKPIAIHEILDGNSEESFRLKCETLALYEEGLELFFRREFGKAAKCFDSVVRKHPDDNPARLYLDRCGIFAVNPPPEDWTGVVVLMDK